MLWINSYVPIKCWDLFQGRGSRLLCILDPMPRQFSSPVIHPHLHFPTQVPATLPSGYFSISEPAPDHWTHRYFVVWHHRQPRIPSTNLWEKCKPLSAHPCLSLSYCDCMEPTKATQSNWLPWHQFTTHYQGKESSWASLTNNNTRNQKYD